MLEIQVVVAVNEAELAKEALYALGNRLVELRDLGVAWWAERIWFSPETSLVALYDWGIRSGKGCYIGRSQL